jgi:uncharacterized membrane protein
VLETGVTLLADGVNDLKAGHKEIIAWQKAANGRAWAIVATILSAIMVGIISLFVQTTAAKIEQQSSVTTTSSVMTTHKDGRH